MRSLLSPVKSQIFELTRLDSELRGANCAGSLVLAFALLLLGLAVPDACAQPFTSTNSFQDFNTLGVVGNKNPYGIFGKDGIMLVSDRIEGKIYSYSLETKERQDSNAISDDFVLYRVVENSRTNIHPYGIWSDGTTLWAAHNAHIQNSLAGTNSQIYAYAVTWVTNGMKRYLTGVRDSSKDIPLKIETASQSLLNYGSARKPALVNRGGETIKTNGLYGNYSPSGIWSDGETMWVADTGENMVRSITNRTATTTNKYSARFSSTNKIYAYNLWTTNSSGGRQFDGSRDEDEDIRLRDGNTFAQGLWSDGETMWVADFQGKADDAEKKIYAYNMTTKSRDSEKDYDTLNKAGNDRPRGIWSDGETMWVADQTDNKLYAYHAFRSSTSRNLNAEFDTLKDAGNNNPRGIWSNGTTMWVTDDGNDKLYAYNLTTKQRDPDKDFVKEFLQGQNIITNTVDGMETTTTNYTASDNLFPQSLYSDGETMWMAHFLWTGTEGGQWIGTESKLFAYDLDSKARDADEDFDTLLTAGNQSPVGLWSNDTTMWVADSQDGKIYAYKMSDKSRDSSKDFDTLEAAGNTKPKGIYSDGTTMWVADSDDDKIYAYKMSDKTRDAGKDFDTLKAAGNNDPFGIWSDDTTTMWVLDSNDDKIYAYPLSNAARLGKLELKGHIPSRQNGDFKVQLEFNNMPIPSFNSGTTTNYTASVPYATTSLTVSPKTLRPNDTTASSHRVNLIVGDNSISITVTNGQATGLPRTRTYTINVEREFFTFNDPGKDIALASAHANPRGLWANESIMYVANIGDTNKLYAYNKADGTRFSELVVEVVGQTATTNTVYSKDITLDSTNYNPRGIWSDGTTIWVADSEAAKLYAYQLANGNPDTSKDFDLIELSNAENINPEWIWSDGAIMWVSDSEDKKIYAYNMSDKTRNPSREIELSDLSEANDSPQGLWSDGENLWVANGTAGNVKLYAYKLAGEVIDCRDETKDFNTLESAGNLQPKGIFSDGATMYVIGDTTLTNVANGNTNVYKKIYAYNQPLSDNASLRRVELSDVYYADETFNDYFQNARRLDFYPNAYVLYSTNATTTISNIETQDPRVNVEKQGDDLLGWKIQSPADADPNTAGHQVRLKPKLKPDDTTEITIIVTAQSGASREHIIRIANDPSGPLPFRDFNDLYSKSRFNTDINGLWADGTTMWLTGQNAVYAYNMEETDGKVWGAVKWINRSRGIPLDNRNGYSSGLWGQGTTMWVANSTTPIVSSQGDFFTKKIFAYNRTTGSRVNLTPNSALDFNTSPEFTSTNSAPAGLWSDGTTMWIVERNADAENNEGNILAYTLATKSRDETKDISIDLSPLDGGWLLDIWANQTNFWVLLDNEENPNDLTYEQHLNEDRVLYAYEWGTTNQNGNAVRDPSRDIPLRKGVSSPHYLKGAGAIFAHNGIMYVSNWEPRGRINRNNDTEADSPADLKIYAYGLPTSLPPTPSDPSAQSGAPVNLILKDLSLSGISLSPAFSPDTLFYTASVEFDVASTTVTATPNDSEASVSIFWGPPGSTSETGGQGPQASLREGENIIIVEVTAGNGFSRLRYFVVVNKLKAPPVSGGPLPLSFQPSSAAATAGKSRLMAADSLPNGGIRFVFLVHAGEFQIEKTVDLLGGNWRPLPEDAFQSTRESIGQGQDRLTVILPSAEGKHRFLRLTPATPAEKKTLEQEILPEEAILFPFLPCFVWLRRQNRGMQTKFFRIGFVLIAALLTVVTAPFSMAELHYDAGTDEQPLWDGDSPVSAGGWISNTSYLINRYMHFQIGLSPLPGMSTNLWYAPDEEAFTHRESPYAPLNQPGSILHGRTRTVADAILFTLYVDAWRANDQQHEGIQDLHYNQVTNLSQLHGIETFPGPEAFPDGCLTRILRSGDLEGLVNVKDMKFDLVRTIEDGALNDPLTSLKKLDLSFPYRVYEGFFDDVEHLESLRIDRLPGTNTVFRKNYDRIISSRSLTLLIKGSPSVEVLTPPVNVGSGYVFPGVSPSPPPTEAVVQRSSDLRFTSTSLSLAEGESATYQVRATASRAGDMVVNLATAHSGITVQPSRLTFYSHNWQTFQTVTVTASADAADTNEQASIMHSIPASNGFIANNNAGIVSVSIAHTVVEEEEVERQNIQEVKVDPTDYDQNDDGLIEISNLAQLHAIRWDLNGDGQPDKEEFANDYALAFPGAIENMGAPADVQVHGYELDGDLDFGDNPTSWESIGVFSQPFQAVFEGNNHVIVNLFQDQSDPAVFINKPSGLFGSIGHRGLVMNLGLEEVNIHGVNWVGALVGLHQGNILACSATGRVEGENGVGGLVGQNFGDIVLSVADVEVKGFSGVGDLVGIDRFAR